MQVQQVKKHIISNFMIYYNIIMESLIAIGIGIAIGISSLGKSKILKIIVQTITGG